MATEHTRQTTAGLPERVVADLLSSERRRHVLSCLDEHGPLAVSDLATAVAARERGIDPEEVGRETRRDVRTAIYEHHLPKLTATGAVEFDSMRGTITLRMESLTAAARR